MTDIETIVVGAGVVGLATAAALAASGQEVVVLEREATIGQGTSSRNSEVIHAGIYYPPDSLKARLCVRGKDMLYRYCAEHNVPHKRLGKLVVATDDTEITTLQALQKKAIRNGVKDTNLLTQSEAKAMQAGLSCVAALHSPSTGIVDSHALMLSLHADLEYYSGTVAFNTEVHSLQANDNHLQVSLTDGTTSTTKNLINCCGLTAVPMARTIPSLPADSIPTARYAKGNYFKLQGRTPFNALIYPAPVVGGLGVHLTIDLAGQQRFGPDVEWLDSTSISDNDFNYHVDPHRADSFYAAIRKYWPDLPDNSLVPDYAGIRPKIQWHGTDHIDFEFSTPQHHGINGLVNMYGIESPGLTSSLAIAEHIKVQL